MRVVSIPLAALCAGLILNAQTSGELADKAERLIRAGNASDAVRMLSDAAQNPGNSAESEDRIGFLFAVLGKSAEAMEHFQKSESLDATYAPAHFHAGAALWLAKDYEHALPELQTAVKLSPKSADYRFRLGSAYLEQQQFDLAAGEFKEAIAQDASRPDIWNSYGQALRGKKDLAGAIDAYVHALDLNPGG